MTEVERQILSNQEAILLALDKLITPLCKGMNEDENGETVTSFALQDNYRKTKELLDNKK